MVFTCRTLCALEEDLMGAKKSDGPGPFAVAVLPTVALSFLFHHRFDLPRTQTRICVIFDGGTDVHSCQPFVSFSSTRFPLFFVPTASLPEDDLTNAFQRESLDHQCCPSSLVDGYEAAFSCGHFVSGSFGCLGSSFIRTCVCWNCVNRCTKHSSTSWCCIQDFCRRWLVHQTFLILSLLLL